MSAFDPESLAKAVAAAPSWRAPGMEAAYRVFSALPEPTPAQEDWRYLELDLGLDRLRPVLGGGEPLGPGPFASALPARAGHALVVDGVVVGLDGEVLRRFADFGDDPGLAGLIPPDHNKLAAAHAAYAADGVVVEVPPGTDMETPVVIEVQGTVPGSASFPHLEVRVGDDAGAQVMVVYRSAPGAELLMVPGVDLVLGNGSRLRFLSVQAVDPAASVINHQRVRIGRDATSRIGEVGLGGRLGRLDLGVRLEGNGASSEVVGLYFGEGEQTLDYRVVVEHLGRSTTSEVFLKGAVEDDAQSVFTGLLRIEKQAARTSTFETNRNLVLSERAKAHSVPNLEILCNDVVCGHASSVGPLEEEHLYYLLSRGLSRTRAERLLIRGFFREVIDRLPIAGVDGPVSAEVFRRFVTAQEEGRVG